MIIGGTEITRFAQDAQRKHIQEVYRKSEIAYRYGSIDAIYEEQVGLQLSHYESAKRSWEDLVAMLAGAAIRAESGGYDALRVSKVPDLFVMADKSGAGVLVTPQKRTDSREGPEKVRWSQAGELDQLQLRFALVGEPTTDGLRCLSTDGRELSIATQAEKSTKYWFGVEDPANKDFYVYKRDVAKKNIGKHTSSFRSWRDQETFRREMRSLGKDYVKESGQLGGLALEFAAYLADPSLNPVQE